MTPEQSNQSPPSSLREVYGLSEREGRDYQVGQERFEQILADEQTTVHEIQESYNNYGSWLFVTVSRPAGERRISVTYYGAGYHELRERWYTDRWFWYRANNFPDRLERVIPKDEAKQLIQDHLATIGPYVIDKPQSPRAKLFEFLAELTDDDGAYTELEDLGELADWLTDQAGSHDPLTDA